MGCIPLQNRRTVIRRNGNNAVLHNCMKQRHWDFGLFCDFYVFRCEKIVNHQAHIDRLLDGRPDSITLLEIAGKLSQSQRGLKKAFSAANTAQSLRIQLFFTPCKGRPRNDRCRNSIAHILQRSSLPLRPLLLGENRLCADGTFHFITLKTDITDGVQHFNTIDLPAKLFRL